MASLRGFWIAVHSRFQAMWLRRSSIIVVAKVVWLPRVPSLTVPRRRVSPALAASHGQLSLF
jgi:hypothetical protein